MYEKYLIDAGLTPEQAKIYEILLKNGSIQAGRLALIVGIKRPLVYKILEQLMVIGLAEKVEKDKIARFLPTHPSKLKEILDNRKQSIVSAESSLDGIMGGMASDFNLISGKPNVQFFEGEKGILKVLDDTLQSRTEVLQFTDLNSISLYIPDINAEYRKKRERKNIQKRIIVPNTEKNRELIKTFGGESLDFRLAKHQSSEIIDTIIYIYDNKVSYVTLKENQMVGVIIESSTIYNTQKFIFEELWKDLPIIKTSSTN